LCLMLAHFECPDMQHSLRVSTVHLRSRIEGLLAPLR
jgi:hypothetical protein